MIVPRSLRHESGFTLIELLTVVAIIGLLMSMTTMGIFRAFEKAKVGRAEADLKHLADAVDAYRISYGTAPPAEFDLLVRQDLDSDPADTGDSPSEVNYLKRLDLGNQAEAAFYDVFSDPEWPYIYIGAYSKNADIVQEYLRTTSFLADGNFGPTNNMYQSLLSVVRDELAGELRIPPSKMNLFVIMSTGPHDPEQTFGGLRADMSDIDITDGLSEDELKEIRMRRLTAYVLATLDKNDNGHLDYDYRSRSKKHDGHRPDGTPDLLPDGSNFMGPIIKTGG